VLATGPNVLGFKPGPRATDFKGDKNPQHIFLKNMEVKPEVPCRNILRHEKEVYEYEIFRRQNRLPRSSQCATRLLRW
jgi:hypothetical protein